MILEIVKLPAHSTLIHCNSGKAYNMDMISYQLFFPFSKLASSPLLC